MRFSLFTAVALAIAVPVGAEAPVSIGNTGAYQRANLSAAGPGSVNPEFDPVREEPGRFKLQFFFPFICQAGSPQLNGVVPTGFTPDPDKCATDTAQIDAADAVAPVYIQPSYNKRAQPGYLYWLWPILPQLSFGSADGVYEAQLGVLVSSMGNGTLVRRFTNSPNSSFRRAGAYFELRTPSFTAEAMLADASAPLALMAGRIAIRPLALLYSGQVAQQPVEFDHNLISAPFGRWITGFTVVTDLVAPVRMPSVVDPGVGPADPFATLPVEVRSLVGVGFENQLVVLDQDTTEAVGYVDVNALGAIGNRTGVGAHAGVRLGGQAGQLRLRLELEGNVAGPGYVPGYFDQLYMIERLQMIGVGRPKLAIEAPASFGYLYRLSLSYLPYVSVFLEGADQLPIDAFSGGTSGANSGRLTGGLSASWLLFGGTMSLSQSGVQHYAVDLLGPGLVFLAEGRMSIFFSYLQLLGRFFAVGDPGGGPPSLGGYFGLEINLSV